MHRFTAGELDTLSQHAAQCNEQLGITGVLLYGGGRFFQLLEGDADAIESLYLGKIALDPRHAGCMVLLNEPCDRRLFPNWSMGRLFLQQEKGAAQRSWDALCSEIARQNPNAVFSRDPAIHCINMFIEHFGDDLDKSAKQLNVPSLFDAEGDRAVMALLSPC